MKARRCRSAQVNLDLRQVDACHCHCCDALTAADETHLFVSRCLYADACDLQAEGRRQIGPHLRDVRIDLWSLGDKRRVDVQYTAAAARNQLADFAENLEAADSTDRLVRI